MWRKYVCSRVCAVLFGKLKAIRITCPILYNLKCRLNVNTVSVRINTHKDIIFSRCSLRPRKVFRSLNTFSLTNFTLSLKEEERFEYISFADEVFNCLDIWKTNIYMYYA